MDEMTMELYLMIDSSDEIIDCLKKEGIKTKKQATYRMNNAARTNAIQGVMSGTASGIVNSNLTAMNVIKAFED